jgi:Na+/H+-dicarboxylate symporter
MPRYLRLSLTTRLLVALVLSVVLAAVFGERTAVLRPLGELYITFLKILVVPVVFFTLLDGLARAPREGLGRLGLATLGTYLSTTLAATLLGVAAAMLVLSRWPGMTVGGEGWVTVPTTGSLLGLLDPRMVLAALARGELLPALAVAMIAAVVLARGPIAGMAAVKSLTPALRARGLAATRLALRLVLVYAPIGVIGLLAPTFARLGIAAAGHVAGLVVAVYSAQAAVFVGCLLLIVLARLPIRAFIYHVRDALITAFATGSSAATLPFEMEAAVGRLKLDPAMAAFVLPVGTAIHKLGSAAYVGAVAVFAAASGPGLASGQAATIALLAFLTAVTVPPISGGAFVMLTAVFSGAGLPIEVIALAAGIPLLGRLNTPLNALGRLLSAAILAARLGTPQSPEPATPTITTDARRAGKTPGDSSAPS